MASSRPVESPNSHSSDFPPSSPVPVPPRRQSSIRFSEDTNTTSRSPMSRGWRTGQDEVTPIRSAEVTQSRNYQTSRADEEEDSSREDVVDDSTSPKPAGNSTGQGDADEDKDGGAPWYKRIADKYGSVSLENKGSVARDHLALERTFLAWLRTSLAFASIGIAITQLFRLNTTIASRSQQISVSKVPFSPFLGQSVPAELLPYLQQAAISAATELPKLGPTLLDQLLLLPAADTAESHAIASTIRKAEFDEHAASKLRHVGKPLGATFLGISVVVLFIGFHRYFESQYWIIRGKFPASRGSVFLVGFITGALIIASLVVVLVVAPTSFEKKT